MTKHFHFTRLFILLLILNVSIEAFAPLVGSQQPLDFHASCSTPDQSASSPLSLTSSSLQMASSDDTASYWTREELESYAEDQGVILSLSTLGPGYRGIARAKHNTSMIVAYVEGFIRPTGNLLHVDKMEVFRPLVQKCRDENPDEFTGGGTSLGVGLLVAYLCLWHGQQEGQCREAEFLAIDDEDFQHKRLVRLYRHAGFRKIKYVGDDIWDVPDRMVWGGCGTLLRAEIPELLRFWTSLFQKSATAKKNQDFQ